jgi:hypothetical protein
MSQLNAPRFVELYNLAVQRDIQTGSRDRDLNEIRVCSLVGCYFAGTDDPGAARPFSCDRPPHRTGFGADSVSRAWPREKLSTPRRREAAFRHRERPRPEVRCSTAAPALPGKRRNARLPLVQTPACRGI